MATLAAGVLLAAVAAQSLGLFGGSSPRIAAPCSLLLVAPVFMGLPVYLVLVAPPVIFWAWAATLFGGEPVAPKRGPYLLGTLGLLSLAWFILGWSHGLRFEGAEYTYATAALSCSCAAAIGFLLYWSRRLSSFPASLAAHWLLIAWAITFAFPYLGEAP